MHFCLIASSFPIVLGSGRRAWSDSRAACVAFVGVVLHHFLCPFSSLNISQYLNAASSVPGCLHCHTNILTEQRKCSLYVIFDIFLLKFLSNHLPIVPNEWPYICTWLRIVELLIICVFRLAQQLCALFAPLSNSTILIVFLLTILMVVCKPFVHTFISTGFQSSPNIHSSHHCSYFVLGNELAVSLPTQLQAQSYISSLEHILSCNSISSLSAFLALAVTKLKFASG
jgi:hypothetical protein